jgi:hypothetical protein
VKEMNVVLKRSKEKKLFFDEKLKFVRFSKIDKKYQERRKELNRNEQVLMLKDVIFLFKNRSE